MSRLLQSIIQSDFHDGSHGNFEAVLVENGSLVHWFRSNVDSGPVWKRGEVIVTGGVAGPGSIIQSDFKQGPHGNFEVVVPLKAANGSLELWHFFHDNSDVTKAWQQGQRIATNVAGPGCIIQSDIGSTSHGNFEVVVPVSNGNGGMTLVHFFHDNSNAALPWTQGQQIAANVAGPGCIIQSDFKTGSHGNFEVVVPLPVPGGGQELWHFFHDNSNVALPWQRGQRVAQFTTGPGSLIQSDFKTGTHGNFEVIVPLGKSLVHFFHDNSNAALPWGRGPIVTDVATGCASIMRSDYGTAAHKNFEVLVEEGTQSIVSYYRPNENINFPWMRAGVVLGEPYPSRATMFTRKVCQLTGEYDRQGWDGAKNPPPFAFNRTESRFSIRGCDLGSSFEHKNRVYFLFGDTFRTTDPPDRPTGLDSIAFTTDTDPTLGLHLTFLPRPPLVPGIDQSAFNVPLDGVSYEGAMYVFFSTGHYQVDGQDLMGSSVLARSTDDGQNYQKLGIFSSNKFINVSIEPGVLDQAEARLLNMAVGTSVLWIFGSGRYRASAVYLAVMPLSGLPNLAPVLYLNADGKFRSIENDAAALVPEGDIGELSARWNPFLSRWLLLFNSSNPRGILMHSAPHPWGPWTPDPVMVFDPGKLSSPNDPCSGAGYGKFMHIPWNGTRCDHVQDDMWSPGTFRDKEFGGEYGPYQITRYATGAAGQTSQIWFTMSTWNPYQSMLMTTAIVSSLL